MTPSANSGAALDPADWQTVNDDVMGGVSTSRVRAVPGGLRFEGVVAFDFGGGFASARRDYALPAGISEAAFAGFALSLRGDGKRYRLTLFTRSDATGLREPYHYQAKFETTGTDQAIKIPLADFAARLRGHTVTAPPIAPSRMVALGLQISDRQEGPFALEVRSIEPIVAG
jgi:monofunctional biosynthetic peptidoglycan transglycosylase